jgi:ATP-dependent protease HslVU (ClpYQ) peptidase subunit
VFQNGPYLIGFAGEIRGGQVLKPEFWTPPDDIKLFGDQIRIQFNEKDCCQKSEEGSDATGTGFIIGWKGMLIQITSDFQIAAYEDDFAAIGAGADYSLSILYHTRKHSDPMERIIQAHRCASYFCAAVSKEYRMFVLENNEVVELNNE